MKKMQLKQQNLNVDVIMLDNFEPESAKKAAKKIKKINNKILIEISGGINTRKYQKICIFCR